jgi:hypothetical protein
VALVRFIVVPPVLGRHRAGDGRDCNGGAARQRREIPDVPEPVAALLSRRRIATLHNCIDGACQARGVGFDAVDGWEPDQ